MGFPEFLTIRLALIIAALVFLLGAYLNGGQSAQPDWMIAAAQIWWTLCKDFVFPLWLIMRTWTLVGSLMAGR